MLRKSEPMPKGSTMNELKDDVLKMYKWFQEKYPSEEVDYLLFDLNSALGAINEHINATVRKDINDAESR